MRLSRTIPLRPRSAAALFLALALAGNLSATAPLAQESVDLDVERQVRDVEFTGNTNYKAKALRKLLRTRQSSFWKPWKKSPLRQDFIRADRVTLVSYYRRRGYLWARVDSVSILPTKKPEKSDVVFHLTEGPRAVVKSVRIEGAGPIPESTGLSMVRLKPGSPFDVSALESGRDTLMMEYADLGHVVVQVRDSLVVDSTRVHVLYQVKPGPIVRLDSLSVEGTKKTKPNFVSREVKVKPGKILTREKLVESQENIYTTALYSDVQMEIGPIDTTDAADLIVKVREAKMGWVDAGVGYGTVDNVRLTAAWGQRNIGHTGMLFVASGALGIRILSDSLSDLGLRAKIGDRRLNASLTRPWLFGTRTSGTLGAYYDDQLPVTETSFPLTAIGASILLSNPIMRDTRGYVSNEVRHVLSDSASIANGDSAYTTDRFILSGERDTRRNIFNPVQGHDVIARTEFVLSGSPGTDRFTNLTLSASTYVPVRRRGAVLALHMAAGYIEPWGSRPEQVLGGIPVEDRFRTGGASTVRGYLEQELGTIAILDSTGAQIGAQVVGGQVLLQCNAELRFPLLWIFSGALFFDGGNVWQRAEDMNLTQILSFSNGVGYNDMRYSIGTGLRIGTPVGPIRFDYGWKIRLANPATPDLSPDRGQFYFTLGNPF